MAFFVAGVDLNDLNVIDRSAHRAGATHAAKGRQGKESWRLVRLAISGRLPASRAARVEKLDAGSTPAGWLTCGHRRVRLPPARKGVRIRDPATPSPA
jgi:hypothetical protein